MISLLRFRLDEELRLPLPSFPPHSPLFLSPSDPCHLPCVQEPRFLIRTRFLLSFSICESTCDIHRIHWKKIPSRCNILDSSLAESIWESYCHGYQTKRHLSGPLLCRVWVHPLRCVTFSRVRYSNITQIKVWVTLRYNFELISEVWVSLQGLPSGSPWQK